MTDSLANLQYGGANESSFHGHLVHAIKKENAVACSTHLDEGPTSSCHRVVSLIGWHSFEFLM